MGSLSHHYEALYISPEQSIALTKFLHRNIHLGCLCLHSKLYAHIIFGHVYRTGRIIYRNGISIIKFPLLCMIQSLVCQINAFPNLPIVSQKIPKKFL